MKIGIDIKSPIIWNDLEGVNEEDVDAVLFYTGPRPEHLSDEITTTLLCKSTRIANHSFFAGEIKSGGVCGFIRLLNKEEKPLKDASMGISCGDIVVRNIFFIKGGYVFVNPSDLNRTEKEIK